MSVEKTLVVSYGAKTSTTMPAATETMVVEMAEIPVLASAAITEMQSIAKTMTPTTTETIVVEMDQVPLVVVNAAIKEMLSMIAAKIQPVMVRYTNNHTMTTIISSPKITIFKRQPCNTADDQMYNHDDLSKTQDHLHKTLDADAHETIDGELYGRNRDHDD